MKLGVMQPYFLPYIGYFQLIAAVDSFIVYDNIQYTKHGWINRNRLLRNGEPALFSLPLKRASDFAAVRERELAVDFKPEKLLNQFVGAYRKAPYFGATMPLIEEILRCGETNLFRLLHGSIERLCRHLNIETPITISSDVAIDHGLTKQDKVLALCREIRAETYVNAIGGVELYSPEGFRSAGVELRFIRTKPSEYAQFDNEFVPALSILDVLMFNSLEAVRKCVRDGYDLIAP
jgi:WbqC-like protein family